MFRLNWAICGLLTMFLFPFVPVRAQAEKKEEKDRFTQRQRQHLKVYAAIQLASRNGQVPDDKIFQAFYGPVAESCREQQPKYQKVATDFAQRLESALTGNRAAQAEQLQKEQLAYQAIADACAAICKAFDAKKTRPLQMAIREFAAAELELNTLRLQRLEREWFTPQEAEKIYVSENRKQSAARGATPAAANPTRTNK